VTLDHEVAFDLDLALAPTDALEFVRDVPRSLSRADFLRSLHLEGEDPTVVVAELPVNAALFGQRLLPFRSELRRRRPGARLVGLPLDHDGRAGRSSTVTPWSNRQPGGIARALPLQGARAPAAARRRALGRPGAAADDRVHGPDGVGAGHGGVPAGAGGRGAGRGGVARRQRPAGRGGRRRA
jgi:hypothetical protein